MPRITTEEALRVIDDPRRMMKTAEVADLLRVHPNTAKKYMRKYGFATLYGNEYRAQRSWVVEFIEKYKGKTLGGE